MRAPGWKVAILALAQTGHRLPHLREILRLLRVRLPLSSQTWLRMRTGSNPRQHQQKGEKCIIGAMELHIGGRRERDAKGYCLSKVSRQPEADLGDARRQSRVNAQRRTSRPFGGLKQLLCEGFRSCKVLQRGVQRDHCGAKVRRKQGTCTGLCRVSSGR